MKKQLIALAMMIFATQAVMGKEAQESWWRRLFGLGPAKLESVDIKNKSRFNVEVKDQQGTTVTVPAESELKSNELAKMDFRGPGVHLRVVDPQSDAVLAEGDITKKGANGFAVSGENISADDDDLANGVEELEIDIDESGKISVDED